MNAALGGAPGQGIAARLAGAEFFLKSERRLFVMIKYLFGLVLAFALICGAAHAQETAGRVRLPGAESEDALLHGIHALDSKGLTCVTGTYFNLEENVTYGLIYVVDRQHGKVLWHKQLADIDGAKVSEPVDCRLQDGNIFLLVNKDMGHSLSLNLEEFVEVYKFDLGGRQLGFKKISALKYANWAVAYGFGESDGRLFVVGMEYLQENARNRMTSALFSLPMNTDLSFGKALERETGAYDSYSAMRVVGEDIFISGRFSPHVAKLDEDKGSLAASRIRLNGKYVWSTKFDPSDNFQAYVTDSGAQYLLDTKEHKSVLSRLDPDGKPAGRVAYSSRYCGADAFVVAADRLFAVRSKCAKDDSHARSVVSIDSFSGAEKLVTAGDLQPDVIAPLPDGLGVIGRDAKKQRYLQALPAATLQP
jgi:hypothetical protein